MKAFSPQLKGLITSVLMIALALWIDRQRETLDERVQYFVFLVYAMGILWALVSLSRSGSFTGRFGQLFSEGFKTFIVITLSMVAFTFVYVKLHPELADQEYVKTKQYYQQQKQNDRTPNEIEEYATKAKKQYNITVISLSIFRYLIIGALLTAVIGFLLTRKL
jgi:hypothetical protein